MSRQLKCVVCGKTFESFVQEAESAFCSEKCSGTETGRKLNLGCGKDIKKGYENLDRKDIDLEKLLPFETSTIKEIVLKEVIEHIRNHSQLLRECNRVLKIDGTLYLTTPNYRSFGHRLLLLLGRDTFLRNYEHVRFFTDQTITLELEEAGFFVEKLENNSQTLKFLPAYLAGNIKIFAWPVEKK